MPVKTLTSPDWDDLRIFRALAEHRTLSATARALGVTHATIARRIERLEQQFATPLFDKRPSGYALTSLGSDLDRHVAAMQQASLDISQLQQQERVQLGAVRISAPRSITDAFLVPSMAAIRDRLAGIELTVLTESRVVSVAKWETDIALRLGRPDDGAIVARKLGAIRYRLCAIPGASASFIGYAPEDRGAEAVWLERHAAGQAFAFRSNSQVAQQAAAAAGLGTALLPSFLITDGLRPVDDAAHPPDREVFLLSRREALRRPHIRAAFDALVELFRLSWR